MLVQKSKTIQFFCRDKILVNSSFCKLAFFETLTTLLAIILNQVACNFASHILLSLISLVKEEFIQLCFFFLLCLCSFQMHLKFKNLEKSLSLTCRGYQKKIQSNFQNPSNGILSIFILLGILSPRNI